MKDVQGFKKLLEDIISQEDKGSDGDLITALSMEYVKEFDEKVFIFEAKLFREYLGGAPELPKSVMIGLGIDEKSESVNVYFVAPSTESEVVEYLFGDPCISYKLIPGMILHHIKESEAKNTDDNSDLIEQISDFKNKQTL